MMHEMKYKIKYKIKYLYYEILKYSSNLVLEFKNKIQQKEDIKKMKYCCN